MSNFMMKKNPFMSLWLSGANRVVASGRGLLQTAARRQQAAALKEATRTVAAFWSGSLNRSSARKRTKSGQ